MNKLRRSWILFKCSVSVVLQNKKLLVFPILSFVCTLVILAFVITPVAFQRTGYHLSQGQHWKAVGESLFMAKTVVAHARDGSTTMTRVTPKPLAIGVGASVYLVAMFLATFFNVAFFHQILQALRGSAVSVRAGLQFAVSRLKAIFLWSLFAGLIGLLIKTLEERLEVVGQIVLRIVGTAWSLASVFVIPVLIVEPGANPINVLRKSASTLKKTWGESLAGYVGLQFGGALVFVVSLAFLIGSAFLASALKSGAVMGVAVVLWVFGLLAFAYLTNVASQVYRCALYVYASEGNIPQPYSNELLQMAWKTKNS
jgi:hypothetical protein